MIGNHSETEVEKAVNPKVTLEQWVVKGPGRGEKYLKRQWPPTSVLWLSSQGKAERFSLTDAEREARSCGGRPVKLIAARRLIRKVPALKSFLGQQSKGAPRKEVLRWIHGVDEIEGSGYTEADCFCTACATKVVEKLQKEQPERADAVNLCVDGGWGSDEDGPRFCDACSVPLQHSLTDYGVEEEFSHFRTYPPALGTPSHWDAISLAVQNLPDDSPLWAFVERWERNVKRRAVRRRR